MKSCLLVLDMAIVQCNYTVLYFILMSYLYLLYMQNQRMCRNCIHVELLMTFYVSASQCVFPCNDAIEYCVDDNDGDGKCDGDVDCYAVVLLS